MIRSREWWEKRINAEPDVRIGAGTYWYGPGRGWQTFEQWFLSELAEALNVPFHMIRAGRLPGSQENTMSTKFRFALGAAVVLSTSLAAATEAATERDTDVHRDAERAASNARDEIYRASGRTDLVERRVDMATDGDSDGGVRRWRVSTLQPYRQPIEAGEVIGRAEYKISPPSYLVRYRCGDGRQIESWIDEEALALDPRVVDHTAVAAD